MVREEEFKDEYIALRNFADGRIGYGIALSKWGKEGGVVLFRQVDYLDEPPIRYYVEYDEGEKKVVRAGARLLTEGKEEEVYYDFREEEIKGKSEKMRLVLGEEQVVVYSDRFKVVILYSAEKFFHYENALAMIRQDINDGRAGDFLPAVIKWLFYSCEKEIEH